MQLEYDLTPEAYRRINTHFVKNDPATRKRRFQFCIVTPLGLMASAAALRLIGDTSGYWAGTAVAGILLLCVSPFYWNYHTRKREDKVIKDGRETGMIGPHTLVTGSDGIAVVTDKAKNDIKWKAINKVIANDECVFLHLTSDAAYIVPDSAFDAVNTRERFLEEVLRYREQAAGIVEAL